MKAIVTEVFIDKDNPLKEYPVGAIVDFDEKRIKDLAERKLVKVVEAEEKPKKATKRKKVD